MDGENYDALVQWFSKELSAKKIPIETIKDLKPGNAFLETIHRYHPKYVELSKVYIKPKNNFEVLQNYKQLSNCFHNLGWKRFEAEKYAKQHDKDCFAIGSFIMKSLSSSRQTRNLEHRNSVFDSLIQNVSLPAKATENSPEVVELEEQKKRLLSKIIEIDRIVGEGGDVKTCSAMILKILDAK